MSIDFTKMKVADMRAELVRLTGINIEEAEAITGKSMLAERIIEARVRLGLDNDASVSFENAEMENTPLIKARVVSEDDEDYEEPVEEAVPVPSIGSPLWQDYVLSHLNDDEFQTKDGKKFPKAAGLRRVVQILCGDIVGSGPVREYIGSDSATVVYEVVIEWRKGLALPQYMSEHEIMNLKLPVRKFTEVADCTPENTPAPYNKHASATASTKAAGRVFKSILQLTCHTAEEMNLATAEAQSTDDVKSVEVSVGDMDADPISKVQKTIIAQLGDRLNIDIVKALDFHGFNTDVSTLTRNEAKAFIVILNRYQTDVTDASMEIPDLIKSTPV